MPSVPTIPDFLSGTVSTLDQLQQLADALTFQANRPIVLARQTVAQTLTNGLFTALTFTVDDVDNVDGHNTSSNTTRYVAQYEGWVMTGGGPNFVPNGTGGRGSRWAVNGVTVAGSEIMMPSVASLNLGLPARVMPVYLAAGDYLELQAWQNSGGNLDTAVTSPAMSVMSALWVSTGVTP